MKFIGKHFAEKVQILILKSKYLRNSVYESMINANLCSPVTRGHAIHFILISKKLKSTRKIM